MLGKLGTVVILQSTKSMVNTHQNKQKEKTANLWPGQQPVTWGAD